MHLDRDKAVQLHIMSSLQDYMLSDVLLDMDCQWTVSTAGSYAIDGGLDLPAARIWTCTGTEVAFWHSQLHHAMTAGLALLLLAVTGSLSASWQRSGRLSTCRQPDMANLPRPGDDPTRALCLSSWRHTRHQLSGGVWSAAWLPCCMPCLWVRMVLACGITRKRGFQGRLWLAPQHKSRG